MIGHLEDYSDGNIFDNNQKICGIVISENLGESYYILSMKDKLLLESMIDFLVNGGNFNKPYTITVCINDTYQREILEEKGFTYLEDADITYTYFVDDIICPDITMPKELILTSQQEYLDEKKVEQLRFFAFNPDGIYDETIESAYKYSRNNPILLPELEILIIDKNGKPISTCTGLLDKENQSMEVEVVATKCGYENRGLAKIVVSECIKKGIIMGVKEVSISAWEQKTRKIYSSFGKPQVLQKLNYKKPDN